MKLLLDTHAWIWAFNEPKRLSREATKALESAESLFLSDISLWEVAMLESNGRIGLPCQTEEWIEQTTPSNILRLIRITPAIAARSCSLHKTFHGDPADRLIAATALQNELTLVTADKKLLAYKHISTLAAS